MFSAGHRSFSVSVPAAGIRARSLKALIAVSPDAAELGFAASAWGLFLAPEEVKPEGADEVDDHAIITPTAGEVNLWVERVVAPAPAAGEPWGPGRWAGGGCGCWAGLKSH